jgi:hypothetical protein
MSEHVEDLELYALGVLEQEERVKIDAHLASCAQCSQRAGQAERVVAAMQPGMFDVATAPAAPVVVPLKRRSKIGVAASGWLAAAAALALAVGLGTQRAGDHARLAAIVNTDDVIAQTLVHSHFLHAAFNPAAQSAPSAKVIYARDGSWLYVVVDGARSDLHVACSPANPKSAAPVDLGAPQARGATSELFAHPPQRPGSLRLLGASGEVLAYVTLTYPAR